MYYIGCRKLRPGSPGIWRGLFFAFQGQASAPGSDDAADGAKGSSLGEPQEILRGGPKGRNGDPGCLKP